MRVVLLFAIAACTGESPQSFYERVEAGSTWRLAIAAPEAAPDFTGSCPMFPPHIFHIPDAPNAGCDTGCTCTFGFSKPDANRGVVVSFHEHCLIAVIDCGEDHAEFGANLLTCMTDNNDCFYYAGIGELPNAASK